MCRLSLGDPAPDFVQQSQLGPIRFHEWLGDQWGLLVSFRGVGLAPCSDELTAWVASHAEWADAGMKVAAVSVESVESLRDWLTTCEYPHASASRLPLIADVDRRVCEAYGLIHPNASLQRATRSVVLIDPKRRVRFTAVYPATVARNLDEVERVARALIGTRDTLR